MKTVLIKLKRTRRYGVACVEKNNTEFVHIVWLILGTLLCFEDTAEIGHYGHTCIPTYRQHKTAPPNFLEKQPFQRVCVVKSSKYSLIKALAEFRIYIDIYVARNRFHYFRLENQASQVSTTQYPIIIERAIVFPALIYSTIATKYLEFYSNYFEKASVRGIFPFLAMDSFH